MNPFYLTALVVLCLFIIRTESYRFRIYIKQLEKEIVDAFAIQRPTRYKPSKYLVIFK